MLLHIIISAQYFQRLVQDHSTLIDYLGYLESVEDQYNSTLQKKPVCGYCVRFNDLLTSTMELKMSLETLVRPHSMQALEHDQARSC